jgi:regulatory protein
MQILNITKDKHIKERYHVRVEGMKPFPVSAETIARYGLCAGMDIDAGFLESVMKEDEKKRALDASLNLLSFAQRSRKELAERLKLKHFSQTAIDNAVERLAELGYINDALFAKNLMELRRLQGRGSESIKFEMRRKGVPPGIISETMLMNRLTAEQEAEAILPIAKKKLTRMRSVPQEKALMRLTGFLERRGFSREVVNNVLRSLKKEFT